MWVTKFRFGRVPSYERVRARLSQVEDRSIRVVFGERAQIEIEHRCSAQTALKAATEAMGTLEILLLRLELTCVPESLHTYHAAGTEPLPELLGLAEVARELGVSKPRASQLASRGDLPNPVLGLRMGPVYDANSIKDYARRRGSRRNTAP